MKIDKATRKTITENAAALVTAQDALIAALEEYNAKREDLRERLQTEVDELNSEFEEKSARWQESDKGEGTKAWIEDIETKLADIADDAEFNPELPDIDEVVGFPDQPEE